MLNPEFRLLDPEAEQLEKLASLNRNRPAGEQWPDQIKALPKQQIQEIIQKGIMDLAKPGVHPASELSRSFRRAAAEMGIATVEPSYFGWSESLLQSLAQRLPKPRTLLLGIMDGDGIWAGAIAGLQENGFDFLATFRLLWDDEPELASKQTFQDLPEICQAVKRRFDRPVTGLFIYRNEFLEWQDQAWMQDRVRQFIANNTAALCEI